MKKILVPAVMIALLALVACGKSEGGGPTPTATGGGTGSGGNVVEMSSVTFVQSSISIKAGGSVTFKDPQSTGGYHILCLGDNQTCKSNPQGPADLNNPSGITFNAGDPDKSIVFAHPGTYVVTCTIHPNMDVTINVS